MLYRYGVYSNKYKGLAMPDGTQRPAGSNDPTNGRVVGDAVGIFFEWIVSASRVGLTVETMARLGDTAAGEAGARHRLTRAFGLFDIHKLVPFAREVLRRAGVRPDLAAQVQVGWQDGRVTSGPEPAILSPEATMSREAVVAISKDWEAAKRSGTNPSLLMVEPTTLSVEQRVALIEQMQVMARIIPAKGLALLVVEFPKAEAVSLSAVYEHVRMELSRNFPDIPLVVTDGFLEWSTMTDSQLATLGLQRVPKAGA